MAAIGLVLYAIKVLSFDLALLKQKYASIKSWLKIKFGNK